MAGADLNRAANTDIQSCVAADAGMLYQDRELIIGDPGTFTPVLLLCMHTPMGAKGEQASG
ncbi:hypothetical protein VM1G_11297 [Cytospora mali]|uniref:Uncharacterized protein n=1 Tax=Cytospora mali TaxID=578113 RepID=A0A194VKI6_CYTMA|nr:hypothetical protein VM1G_11297 [Valsa mali]